MPNTNEPINPLQENDADSAPEATSWKLQSTEMNIYWMLGVYTCSHINSHKNLYNGYY